MRRRLLLRLMSLSALSALLPWRKARAARTADKDTAFLDGLLRTHVLPRMDALVAATTDYAGRLEVFATAPTDAGLADCQAAHHAVTDAFAGVQHLRPGPWTENLRADRFLYWPERASVVHRQIALILNAHDPKLLDPAALAKQSAAVQGLTVLERLLFDEGVTAASFDGDETKRYRGALAAAAARNLSIIATQTRDGWRALREPLASDKPTTLGANSAAAVNTLFVSGITMIQVITDQKLLAPLGHSPDEAKPAVVEALRSGASTRNIALNLEALQALMLGEKGGPGYAALLPDNEDGTIAREAMEAGFGSAIKAVQAIPAPLNFAVVDPAQRKTVEKAFGMIKGARADLVGTVAPLLNITLGFNELDGD